MPLPNRSGPVSDAALAVEDLSFRTGFTSVLRNIRFEIFPGELLLLIGPNGAGKSTLLKCLAGLLPHQGKKEIFGASLKKNYEIRKKVGYVSHESFLYLKFTAKENLSFYSELYGATVDVDSVLRDYHLYDFGDQLVETYSRGMKQKLSLARALLHEPELVFLDEPFTGLDQQASMMLHEKIVALKERAGVILTTHELEQGFELCDKLLILKGGRQVFFGARNEISGPIREFYNERTLDVV